MSDTIYQITAFFAGGLHPYGDPGSLDQLRRLIPPDARAYEREGQVWYAWNDRRDHYPYICAPVEKPKKAEKAVATIGQERPAQWVVRTLRRIARRKP